MREHEGTLQDINSGGVKLLIINNLQKQDYLQNFSPQSRVFHALPPLPPFKGARGIRGWPQAGGVFSSKESAEVRSTFPSLRLTPLLTNHTGAAVICEMSYADKFAIMLVKTILDTVKQVRLPELKVPAYDV